MAKYTEKSLADIAWDEVRRGVEYKLNLAAANAKARLKNEVLPRLQTEFEAALNNGTILELTANAESLVTRLTDEILAEARA